MRGNSRTCRRLRMFVCGLVLCVFSLAAPRSVHAQNPALPEPTAREVDYAAEIEPILRRSCWTCHGPDEQRSGLRTDSLSALLKGGESGDAAIVPGQSAESALIHRVAGWDDWPMPPKDGGQRLAADQISLLRAWIDQGAKMPQQASDVPQTGHWSFQPLQRPHVPESAGQDPLNPIDAFVRDRLQREGLQPSPQADRATLIRRASLDMLGLLPDPDEVARFVADDSPTAYTDMVERLLASPHYGERWARHWLDVVRFAESNGFETNHERPNAYRYRDWVIQALNADLPYDQFVFAQLAGDTNGQDAATGFLVGGAYDIVKSPDPGLTAMQRQDELADMLNTTSTSFLALTVGCARCHTHKFDPILQSDYYSLQAVFAGVQHGDRAMQPSPQQALDRTQQLTEIDDKLASMQTLLARFEPQPHSGRSLVLDDETAGLTELLQPKRGHGMNPEGNDRGEKNDPGGSGRLPNISSGRYTWWDNKPGQDVFAYRPQVRGRWRLWLSWGCGFTTHTTDAEYVLDRDGDPATTGDQTPIATVDQQRFAADSGEPDSRPKWSGLRDVGAFELAPESAILLRGGQHGEAITADVIVLQELGEGESSQPAGGPPHLLPPVQARKNIEQFAPVTAQFVRFNIAATNSVEPCLDELEVWTTGEAPHNVALASAGTWMSSSGDYADDPKHQLQHINDGQYGNAHSWISNTNGTGWVQLVFAQPATIDRIVWGRDREQRFADRLATKYAIEVSLDGETWTRVADDTRRVPYGSGPADAIGYRAQGISQEELARLSELDEKTRALEALRASMMTLPLAYAGTFAQPEVTHRLYRGDPLSPEEEVAPDALRVLSPQLGSLELTKDAPEQDRRVGLARWIINPANPLTPRVIVNRLWLYHFGRGLVNTPSDFGAMGGEPSNAELLDWLAAELMSPSAFAGETNPQPWSLKHIHRLILLSQTYQQASEPQPEGLAADREAALLWRFPPRRLEAEAIRDNILKVSGQLDERMFGPGYLLFVPNENYSRNWIAKDDFGPADFRRMVYALDLRMENDAVFGAFDCPDGGQVTPKRSRSTTPLQALNLFNSRFIAQQADALMERIRKEAGADPAAQIRHAFQSVLLRAPTDEELAEAGELVSAAGLSALCRALFNSNEFLFLR